jgi:uncharacterized protein
MACVSLWLFSCTATSVNQADQTFQVSVVYLTPSTQTNLAVKSSAALTVRDAVLRSGILTRHPELRLELLELGIYGVKVDLEQLLSDGDRVEIYRPLRLEPREARRRRHLQNRDS